MKRILSLELLIMSTATERVLPQFTCWLSMSSDSETLREESQVPVLWIELWATCHICQGSCQQNMKSSSSNFFLNALDISVTMLRHLCTSTHIIANLFLFIKCSLFC